MGKGDSIGYLVAALVVPLLLWPLSPDFALLGTAVYKVATPTLPYLALAWAAQKRDGRGGARFRRSGLRITAAITLVAQAAPVIWWYREYGMGYRGGGAHFTLGCLLTALPLYVAVIVFAGIGLAAEQRRENEQ